MACASARKHMVCENSVARMASKALTIWKAFRDARLGHFVPTELEIHGETASLSENSTIRHQRPPKTAYKRCAT